MKVRVEITREAWAAAVAPPFMRGATARQLPNGNLEVILSRKLVDSIEEFRHESETFSDAIIRACKIQDNLLN